MKKLMAGTAAVIGICIAGYMAYRSVNAAPEVDPLAYKTEDTPASDTPAAANAPASLDLGSGNDGQQAQGAAPEDDQEQKKPVLKATGAVRGSQMTGGGGS